MSSSYHTRQAASHRDSSRHKGQSSSSQPAQGMVFQVEINPPKRITQGATLPWNIVATLCPRPSDSTTTAIYSATLVQESRTNTPFQGAVFSCADEWVSPHNDTKAYFVFPRDLVIDSPPGRYYFSLSLSRIDVSTGLSAQLMNATSTSFEVTSQFVQLPNDPCK